MRRRNWSDVLLVNCLSTQEVKNGLRIKQVPEMQKMIAAAIKHIQSFRPPTPGGVLQMPARRGRKTEREGR